MAVGETLRRLVGKALLATPEVKRQLEKLRPTQTGLGIPGAAESVGIGLQALVNALGPHSSWVILQIDVSNAFNTACRDAILQGTLQ